MLKALVLVLVLVLSLKPTAFMLLPMPSVARPLLLPPPPLLLPLLPLR